MQNELNMMDEAFPEWAGHLRHLEGQRVGGTLGYWRILGTIDILEVGGEVSEKYPYVFGNLSP